MLSGKSGSGKTNVLCNQAEQWADSHLVLFFNGAELHGTLQGFLADEFNWHFSEEKRLPHIFSRLASITDSAGCLVIIVIDAIDESGITDMPRVLSDFVAHLGGFEGRLRLVVSLKDTNWSSFARIGGNKSHLAQHCFQYQGQQSYKNAEIAIADTTPSYELDLFDPEERDDAFSKYSAIFHLTGDLRGEVKDAVRDPFLLRVIAESYEGGAIEIPAQLTNPELLRRYLDRKLSIIDDTVCRDVAFAELVAVAKSLAETQNESIEITSQGIHPYHGYKEDLEVSFISEKTVLKHLPGGMHGEIGLGGIACGILVETRDNNGIRGLRFNYDRVRDHILATHVYQFPELEPSSFEKGLSDFLRSSLSRSALSLYLPNASSEHWGAWKSYVRKNMEYYLRTYEMIHRELRRELRIFIRPHAEDQIGVVYDLRRNGDICFGLFDGKESDELVVEFQNYFREWEKMRGKTKDGIPYASSVAIGNIWSLVLNDPIMLALKTLLDELQTVSRDGGIFVLSCRPLVKEIILAIVHHQRKNLGLPAQPFHNNLVYNSYPFDILPLSIRDMQRRIQANYGKRHYENEAFQRKATLKRSGKSTSYSISLGPEVLKGCKEKALKDAMAGRTFPRPNIVGGYELGILDDAFQNMEWWRRRITKPLLPKPDIANPNDASFQSAFSDRQMYKFLNRLFSLSINNYKRIVLSNFGKLSSILPLFSRFPMIAIVEYHRPDHDQIAQGLEGQLNYSFVSTRHRHRKLAEVYISPKSSPFDLDSGRSEILVRKKSKGWYSCNSIHYSDLSRLTAPFNPVPFERGGSRYSAARCSIVRNFILDLLQEDFRDLTLDQLLAWSKSQY